MSRIVLETDDFRSVYAAESTALKDRLHALKRLHGDRVTAIRRRLAEFRAVPSSEYVYELLYCLLTPQSRAANADAVVEELRSRSFAGKPFDARRILARRSNYIRFHNTKNKRLAAAVRQMPEVLLVVETCVDRFARRDRLADLVDGLGLKEATHFLRNIGRNDGCAILDRHILRNLVRVGVLSGVPKSMSTSTYHQIEAKFNSFAENIAIPVDELDLLFWSIETGEIRK